MSQLNAVSLSLSPSLAHSRSLSLSISPSLVHSHSISLPISLYTVSPPSLRGSSAFPAPRPLKPAPRPQALLGHVEPALAAFPDLLIVPDTDLWAVPWAALVYGQDASGERGRRAPDQLFLVFF